MASLLERLDVGGAGPIRNRGGRDASSPYARPGKQGQSKADVDTVWKHDLFSGPKGLASRLSASNTNNSGNGNTRGVKVDAAGAVQALQQAVVGSSGRSGAGAGMGAGGNLSIKGASSSGALGMNVVQVENLASGTTAADVEAIFKSCGPILESYTHPNNNGGSTKSKPNNGNGNLVTVRLKFKNAEDARKAVAEYNGMSADGNTLIVSLKGSTSTALGGRLGRGGKGGLPVIGDSVDVLMGDDDEGSGGSKMRSDDLLNDPRAVVLTIPPGVDPAEYAPRGGRGRRGGRGGRSWRGGRRG